MLEPKTSDELCLQTCDSCKTSEDIVDFTEFDVDTEIDGFYEPEEDSLLCKAHLAEVELHRQDSLVMRLGKRVQAMLSELAEEPQGVSGK